MYLSVQSQLLEDIKQKEIHIILYSDKNNH